MRIRIGKQGCFLNENNYEKEESKSDDSDITGRSKRIQKTIDPDPFIHGPGSAYGNDHPVSDGVHY